MNQQIKPNTQNPFVLLVFMSIVSLFSSLSYAQESDNSWKLLMEKDGINVYYKYSDCYLNMGYDERRVLLKFENTTGNKALFTYHADLYYDADCKTCNDPYGEYSYDIMIPPNGYVEGKCTIDNPGYLGFFVRWVNQPNQTELTNFEFSDVAVKFSGQ